MQQPYMGKKPSSDAQRPHLATANQCYPQERGLLDHKAHMELFQCDVKTGKVTYGNRVIPNIQVCQVGQAGQPVVQGSASPLTEATARSQAAERGELAQERTCDVDVTDVQSMQAGAVAQLFESCKKKAQKAVNIHQRRVCLFGRVRPVLADDYKYKGIPEPG